jgi:methionine aminopeptidase
MKGCEQVICRGMPNEERPAVLVENEVVPVDRAAVVDQGAMAEAAATVGVAAMAVDARE